MSENIELRTYKFVLQEFRQFLKQKSVQVFSSYIWKSTQIVSLNVSSRFVLNVFLSFKQFFMSIFF